MRKEDDFIVSCARIKFSSSVASEIRRHLVGELDWEYIYQVSLPHGVLPLIYHSLCTYFPAEVPVPFLQRLKRYFLNNNARNLILSSHLLKILHEFKKNGIAVVPFKGLALAEFVYGDIGLRSFSDLDILISEQDAVNAITLLTALGFSPALSLSASQFEGYRKAEDDMVLIHESNGIIVELHWEMTGRFLSRSLNMDFVCKRLVTVDMLDREIAHISAEDLLVYQCVHGMRHLWARLEWICGVAELIKRKEIQWILVFDIAGELRCRRMLLTGIYLANDLFVVELPSQVMEKVKADPVLPEVIKRVKQNLFPLSGSTQVEIGNRFQPVQFTVRDSLKEKIEFGRRELFLPREIDWKWLPLPGRLVGLYCFLRPIRLMYKLFKSILTK